MFIKDTELDQHITNFSVIYKYDAVFIMFRMKEESKMGEKNKLEEMHEALFGSAPGDEDIKVPESLKDPGSELVMMVLSTEGCPPCKTLSKALEVLRDEYEDVEFVKIDSEDGSEIKEFVRGSGLLLLYPTVLISDGKKMIRLTGGTKSVPSEVEFYSKIIECYLSGEIEFKEGKAIIEEDLALPMREIG